MNGSPLRIFLQCFEQNFLGLVVAPVSHVNISLGNRINIIGIDRTRTGLAELCRCRRISGIDTLPASTPEFGISRQGGTGAIQHRILGCCTSAPQ